MTRAELRNSRNDCYVAWSRLLASRNDGWGSCVRSSGIPEMAVTLRVVIPEMHLLRRVGSQDFSRSSKNDTVNVTVGCVRDRARLGSLVAACSLHRAKALVKLR